MRMTLRSGKVVDPFNLLIDDIDINDIAHSLSMLCRFNGHTNEFYSVAQHSVRVSNILQENLRLEGLLHDATEFIIGDLIRPIKRMPQLSKYIELEDRLWTQIALKFNLNDPMHKDVERADKLVLYSEIYQFMHSNEYLEVPIIPNVSKAWNFEQAKDEFLYCYYTLIRIRDEL